MTNKCQCVQLPEAILWRKLIMFWMLFLFILNNKQNFNTAQIHFCSYRECRQFVLHLRSPYFGYAENPHYFEPWRNFLSPDILVTYILKINNISDVIENVWRAQSTLTNFWQELSLLAVKMQQATKPSKLRHHYYI